MWKEESPKYAGYSGSAAQWVPAFAGIGGLWESYRGATVWQGRSLPETVSQAALASVAVKPVKTA